MKIRPQDLSSPSDKGLVADPNEELIAEAEILREELGGLMRELRGFITRFRAGEFGDIYPNELIDILEEIVNG